MSDLITTTQDTYRNACIRRSGRRPPSAPTLAERAKDPRPDRRRVHGRPAARRADHRRRRRHAASPAKISERRQRRRRADHRQYHGRRRKGADAAAAAAAPVAAAHQDPPVHPAGPTRAWDLWPCRIGSSRPWRALRRGRSLVRARAPRHALLAIRLARAPRGQTAAEYLGVLLVVAAIIVAIVATDPGQAISDKLSEIVRDIAGER